MWNANLREEGKPLRQGLSGAESLRNTAWGQQMSTICPQMRTK